MHSGLARSHLHHHDLNKAWPYTVTSVPAILPLTLEEVKSHLRIDIGDSCQDTLLTTLIKTATNYAESYTKKDFITRTYETFRDTFGNDLTIRRSPIQSITSVEYLIDDVLTAVATTVWFLIESNTFPHLSLKASQVWPTDGDQGLREQAVKIVFKSGFGDAITDVPEDLREGMMHHIAAMYENRGDCDEDRVSGGIFSTAQAFLPVDAKLIYDLHRIRSI